MKHKLLSLFIIILFLGTACSQKQMTGVLDDISRDTYENRARKQRLEHPGSPAYEEPPTYDQYQRERKKLIPEEEAPTKDENNN